MAGVAGELVSQADVAQARDSAIARLGITWSELAQRANSGTATLDERLVWLAYKHLAEG